MDAEVGFFGAGNASGNEFEATTLEPDTTPSKTVLVFASCGLASDPPGTAGFVAGVVGMALADTSSTVKHGTVSALDENGQVATDSRRFFSSGRCLVALSGATDDAPKQAEFVSFTDGGSPGFTLNWTDVTGSLHRWGYLMMVAKDSGSFRLINETQPGATGDQELVPTGDAFTPIGALLMSTCGTADGTVETNGLLSLGGGADNDPGGGIWYGSEDTSDPTNTIMRTDEAKTFMLKEDVFDLNAPDAEADLDFTNERSAILDWTTVDVAAREFMALLFGNDEYVEMNPAPAMTPRVLPNAISYGQM